MAIPIRYVFVILFLLVSIVHFVGSVETLTFYPTIFQAVLLVTASIHNDTFRTALIFPTNSSYISPPLANFTPHTTTLDVPLASPALNAMEPVAPERANATFVILCRNSDLDGVIQSVRSVEDRFNRDYGYPYVFLNEEPFDDEFRR